MYFFSTPGSLFSTKHTKPKTKEHHHRQHSFAGIGKLSNAMDEMCQSHNLLKGHLVFLVPYWMIFQCNDSRMIDFDFVEEGRGNIGNDFH